MFDNISWGWVAILNFSVAGFIAGLTGLSFPYGVFFVLINVVVGILCCIGYYKEKKRSNNAKDKKHSASGDSVDGVRDVSVPIAENKPEEKKGE